MKTLLAIVAPLLLALPAPLPDPLPGRVAQDAPDTAAAGPPVPAFVELEVEPATPLAGEAFELRLRVGVATDFLRDNVVPLFRRELDVHLAVEAPWLADPPGATVLDDAPGAPFLLEETIDGRATFALDGEVVTGERLHGVEVDGRPHTVVQVTRRLAAPFPGALEFPAPVLRLAYATEFRENFVDERAPVDRAEAMVLGEPLTVAVGAVPEAGRPVDFTGAVGAFSLFARTSSPRVTVGDAFTLHLAIVGPGADGLFDPPDPRLEHFFVLDVREERGAERREVAYELVARTADVDAVPSLAFTSYDPGRADGLDGYVTSVSAPVPLTVAPSAARPSPVPAPPGTPGGPVDHRPSSPLTPPDPGTAAARGDFAFGLFGLAMGVLAIVAVVLVALAVSRR